MNKIIDGKKISEEILKELEKKINKIGREQIGLAFLFVGEDPASKRYVEIKKQKCKEIGIQSYDFLFKNTISENELIQEIENLNKNKNVDGILVQLPLPSHINPQNILTTILPSKDVDGFHPLNMGKLLLGQKDCFFPCTPYGIKVLLEKEKIETNKKHVVILGRSNIVGKPLFAMLIQKECNATVTIAHSKTANLKNITQLADILVVAVGIPNFVKEDMVKKDAVVIDVGINIIKTEENKKKIVGDVDFKNVILKASKITPVPGGVGPMTIAMLLENTYQSFIRKNRSF